MGMVGITVRVVQVVQVVQVVVVVWVVVLLVWEVEVWEEVQRSKD